MNTYCLDYITIACLFQRRFAHKAGKCDTLFENINCKFNMVTKVNYGSRKG